MRFSINIRTQFGKKQNFAVTQILREINFEDSRSAKSTIFTHLEALNFDFYHFLHFLEAESYQIINIQSPKNGKNGSFKTSRLPKLISRKI